MKLSLIILIVFFCLNLQAAPTCSENGTVVIYTNGVNTKDSEAQAALREIKRLGLSAQIDAKKVEYLLKYNFHGDGARDLLESAIQRFPQTYLNSIKLSKWEAFAQYVSGKLQIPQLISDSIQQEVLERTKAFIESRADIPQYQQTVIDIAEAYDNALNGTSATKKMRVLAISHSQGGLFMNDAYEQINYDKKHKFFAGFQVATPAYLETINHFGYQTHDKDRLIAFIRGTVGALPANMSTPLFVNNLYNSAGDYLIDYAFNHGMTTTYLYDEDLRPQIISTLIETAQKLESNCVPVALFTPTSRAYLQPSPDPMTYDLDASLSNEPPNFDIDPNGFEWLIDGTETREGMNATFTFKTEGAHTVQLIVTDLAGYKSKPKIMQINVVNLQPVADFSHAVQNLTVTLNASNSSDPDGSLKKYKWKIGNQEFTRTSSVTTHTFPNGGTYAIDLIVVDNNDKESVVVKKTLTVGLLGCRDEGSGVSYPGRLHINPNGSAGGFIAEDSVVTGNVTISSDSQVCGTSTIEGKVSITNNSKIFNGILKASIARQEGDGINIYGSTVINSTVEGGLISLIASTVIDGQISGFWHQIQSSSVYSSTISGNYTMIQTGSILNNGTVENQSVNTTTFLTIQASNINSSILALDFGPGQIPIGKSGTITVMYSTVNAPITGYNILIFRSTTNSLIFGFDITRAFSVFP